MEYRILGPLEVRDGGRCISLGTAKQQALLAVLVMNADRFVARDRLIDALWGASPPPTADKAVQVYVSQLRKLLASDVIATRPRGYVLSLDGDGVDAITFDRIARDAQERAASGDAAAAASRFRDALELWRGPALAGLELESEARIDAERLETQRLAVLMERIDCDLSLGRHEHLVGELEGLVAQHPLRERFRGQLMLALYRSDRQADALRVYREGRETLVEQLGLEPSEPLQRLERAILLHDPALDAPAPAVTAREPRRRRRPHVLVAAALLAMVAMVVALAETRVPRSTRLAPNSVGFVDAASGRVARSASVGRLPVALAVARDSVWVANHTDQTVMHLDRRTAKVLATVPVGGHPTGIAVHEDTVWVWTAEGLLVPVDPEFDVAGEAVDLAAADAPAGPWEPGGHGEIAVADGHVWLTAPRTTLIRAMPERHRAFTPPDGVEGAMAPADGDLWVGGFATVFPVDTRSGIEGAGVSVGRVTDLAFGAGSLWVASGQENGQQGARAALRRVDVRSRLIRTTISIGSSPVAVVVAGRSVWVAGGSTLRRVDPETDRVTDAIPIGASPTALAGDADGVWVAVR